MAQAICDGCLKVGAECACDWKVSICRRGVLWRAVAIRGIYAEAPKVAFSSGWMWSTRLGIRREIRRCERIYRRSAKHVSYTVKAGGRR